MALITCPECGQQISDKADICPNCGCPIDKTKQMKFDIALSWGLFGFGLLGGLFFIILAQLFDVELFWAIGGIGVFGGLLCFVYSMFRKIFFGEYKEDK